MTVASQIDISKALAIGGWMSEKELIWLASSALGHRLIVEFGSLHGRSTRALADHCQGTVWAVDPWGGFYDDESGDDLKAVDTYVYPYFKRNLGDHISTGRVIPVRNFSHSFTLPFEVDMIFIDGDHRYESVIRDLDKAMQLVRKGGLISGHDYNHPLWVGVKRAVDDRFSHVETEDSIWWTQKV